ncbi:MAG: alpha/beta hydrolase [Pseudomonadota bacterium]
MREHRFAVESGLELYGREHGATDGPTIVALHGLTRNSEDFDSFAAYLPDGWRMLALDFRGRGQSDYDPNWQQYVPAMYVRDVREVLQQAEIDRAVFLGTSLGGLVTMLLASVTPELAAGAILNDIGCEIDPTGLARIQQYTGKLPPVASWDDARDQVKLVYGETLPGLDDDDFELLARRSFAEDANGVPVLRFDPNIGRAIRELDMELGDMWTRLDDMRDVPMLLLRGENSDILSREVAMRMQSQHPQLTLVEVLDRGHVPLLDESDSVAAIHAFLEPLA